MITKITLTLIQQIIKGNNYNKTTKYYIAKDE